MAESCLVTSNENQGEEEDHSEEAVQIPDDEDDPITFFKVILTKPEPSGVKISKKNCCTVELTNELEWGDNANSEEHLTLISNFVEKQKLSWPQ